MDLSMMAARWRAVAGSAALFAALFPSGAVAQPAPVLDRITAATSEAHDATIRGTAGAVTPFSRVAVMNLHTGHYTIVRAHSDGAFEARLFAAAGSALLVKVDPDGALQDQMDGKYVLGERGEMIALAGTILHVPDPAATSGAATMSGLVGNGRLPAWVAEARADQSSYSRGGSITIEGRYRLLHASIEAGATPVVDVIVSLVGLSRADGRSTIDQSAYCSAVMTPTGLPIERASFVHAGDLARQSIPLQAAGESLQATFRLTTRSIPSEIADGYYRPMIQFVVRGVATADARRIGQATRIDHAHRRRILNDRPYGLLPIVRVGNPQAPRLPFTLLIDTLSQGTRGLTAIEDRDRFAVSSRIAMSAERLVVPRIDERTGTPIRYNLEPAALTVAVGNTGVAPNWPTIPFRFPSGSLSLTVKRPNGETTIIGPAPFRQPRLNGLTQRSPRQSQLDANYMTDAYRLTTGDSRFDVAFLEDGPHEITVSGSIEDTWGNIWTGAGTYLLDVGRPLEIDSALFPGTPLQAGNAINPSVHLLPAVPANVEVRYRFAVDSRRDGVIERTFRAKANTHGYAYLEPIMMSGRGEYRIDVTASFRDARGRWWVGARTWGGVVADGSSPVILHGVRGIDSQRDSRLAWFSRAQIGKPVEQDPEGHVHFAYHSGDVMWMSDDDATTSTLSIDDRERLLTSLLPHREEQVVTGEMSFYSVGPGGVDPYLATSTDNELWAYAYRFVERPRVRIREMVSEETVPLLYWRFNDRYALQSGTDDDGDRPNDFKFQFGGLALSGRALRTPIYSIYASLFVLIANDDPDGTRVFPPFEGNGGGPDGGPLFHLKNRPIDMFFHPTAVRPGTILEVGNIASFAGQIGPPLASKIEILVTSPSGVTRTISGQANEIGFFYKPSSDFVVNEAGVWRAKVRVWHEGRTSAGSVTMPFPTGDILGSRDGEFYFYVADGAAKIDLMPLPQFTPNDKPLTLTVVPPPDLSDVEIYYTTTMPGFVLEEGKLSGSVFMFDPVRLARDFPNLDFDEQNHGPAGETITVSLFLTGKGTAGAKKTLARQVILQGDEILIPSPPRRRRAVRR